MVIAAFYHVDEAWVMGEIFAILNACGSQVDFGARGGFMCSAHVLCVSGANFRYEVYVLEVIYQGSAHVVLLCGLEELRQGRAKCLLA